jgi:hypothetical protein
MISRANSSRKDVLYGAYITAKKERPLVDCKEMDRLFTLLDQRATDPRVPNLHTRDVILWIEAELQKTFPHTRNR